MNKDVKVYKQTKDTCAICCMLMVLEYYKVIEKANWYEERRLYKIYRSKYINGTPFSAVAFHLAKNGLNVTLYHESKNLFENNNSSLPKEVFDLAFIEYKEYLNYAKNKQVNIINGISITINLLKEKLKEDNLIILAGENSFCYHAILLTGYDENSFYICDPLFKTKQIKSYLEISKFINTSIGKWFITVNNKKDVL